MAKGEMQRSKTERHKCNGYAQKRKEIVGQKTQSLLEYIESF